VASVIAVMDGCKEIAKSVHALATVAVVDIATTDAAIASMVILVWIALRRRAATRRVVAMVNASKVRVNVTRTGMVCLAKPKTDSKKAPKIVQNFTIASSMVVAMKATTNVSVTRTRMEIPYGKASFAKCQYAKTIAMVTAIAYTARMA